jgi:hypothetical protein
MCDIKGISLLDGRKDGKYELTYILLRVELFSLPPEIDHVLECHSWVVHHPYESIAILELEYLLLIEEVIDVPLY